MLNNKKVSQKLTVVEGSLGQTAMPIAKELMGKGRFSYAPVKLNTSTPASLGEFKYKNESIRIPFFISVGNIDIKSRNALVKLLEVGFNAKASFGKVAFLEVLKESVFNFEKPFSCHGKPYVGIQYNGKGEFILSTTNQVRNLGCTVYDKKQILTLLLNQNDEKLDDNAFVGIDLKLIVSALIGDNISNIESKKKLDTLIENAMKGKKEVSC
jgi:hypothetical protein